jgi:hypothetical protein
LHNKNSELKDVRSFNFTPVSHFVKAESRTFFFKVSAYLNVFHRKIFKHDEQKGLKLRLEVVIYGISYTRSGRSIFC